MTTQDQNPTETPEGQENGAEGQEEGQEQEPETFSREYVEQLRAEAAENRVKAKAATSLELALRDAVIREATRDILQDPEDLTWSEEYADENGLPDPEKIREAAEALTESKPQLAAVRGDIGAGYRGNGSDAAAVDLSAMLRAGA